MARYFATNSLAGCKRSSTAIVETTTAGRFDSAYVSNAITLANTDYAAIAAPFMDGSTSISTGFWLRFDYNSLSNANNGVPLLLLNGATSGYRFGNSGTQMQYWNGSAWTNWGSTWGWVTGQLYTYTLHLVPGVSFELYQGGTLVASSSATPTGAPSSITEFRFSTTNIGGAAAVSQIMCASYDIRDSHFIAASLNGNSTVNNGGTGSYTDVNETILDETTSETITFVGNKMGQTHASVTVPSGYSISTVVVNARGKIGGSTVTDGKLGVKSGGSSSTSTNRTFNTGFEPRSADFSLDPATGSAWTNSGFNSSETFFQAS